MTIRSLLVAAVVCAAIAPLVRSMLLRYAVLDLPNERSSHSNPTPRGGGIAVGIAAVVALIGTHFDSAMTAVTITACLLGIVGFADDRRSISAAARLAAQLLIPASMLPLLLRGMPVDGWWTWAFGVGVVLWCATFVNAFNFMDGINGMAVAQLVVAGAGLAVLGNRWSSPTLAVLGAAVAGAAIGFAPFNVPIARLFLGDVGSYFVGAWLAATVVVALRIGVPPEIVIAPFMLFLLDTSLTLFRRWRRGEHLFLAHRDHAYQRLTQHGWSHAKVSVVAAVAMATGTAIAVAAAKSSPGVRIAAVSCALALAGVFVLLPSVVTRTRGGALA
ncbi:MAG: MraY family glycosyltransferase [Ilumatobacteraceae bacterium]